MRYLSTGEVAKLCGVSSMSVNRWVHAGRFPNAVRTGTTKRARHRIPEADVHASGLVVHHHNSRFKRVSPTVHDSDPILPLSHRALSAAIVLQAFKDVPRDAGAREWLGSPLCSLILTVLELPQGHIPFAIKEYQGRKTSCPSSKGPRRPGRIGRIIGTR